MAREDLESRAAKNRGETSYSSAYVIEETDAYWTSWLIPVFVVANVAVFLVSMYINNCPKHNYRFHDKCVARFLGRFSFQPLGENPLLGPSSSTLEKLGALEWNRVVHEHQQWRLITFRVGIIYLLSGFGGSVLSSLFIRNSISVGASGALFGLLGAMFSELITNWTIYTNKAAALLTLLVIVIINLAIGILPHVDNFAHIGGFLTGCLAGFILLPRPQFGWIERRNLPADVRLKSKYKAYQYVLWLISLILLIAGFTVGLVMLLRGVNANEHCHWCHYLSCVPTDRWRCD
ncbi:RHOMBOID-like protein 3 isoform X2 [Diospyros lotus]|uniref:RHOMBOID-like protein 3 isoform X2 n=1 Tax=Diospyros lotus TaxID=55363 RepID=UPI0022589115|nr:RHOMBOID-like protein 3 isoform X2 [Diospyros lotus]